MQIYKWVLDSSGSEGFVLWADLWFSGYNTDTYGVVFRKAIGKNKVNAGCILYSK